MSLFILQTVQKFGEAAGDALIRIKIEFLLESNFMSYVSSKHLIFVSS